MLLSVVAIDDAVALIGFGLATTIVKMMGNHVNTNLALSILTPVYDIVISFIVGGVAGILMKLIFRWFKNPRTDFALL